MAGILGVEVATLALATGALAQAADCVPAPPPRLLLERYVSADCAACWRVAPPVPGQPPAHGAPPFVLDWIVPGAADAPLAARALADAAPRAARAGTPAADEALTQTTPLPARSALRLAVTDGPAVHGWIGLQFEARYASTRALPPGLAGWLALVERIDAGDGGSPVARRVVRAVAGPLALPGLAAGRTVNHLHAFRLPDGTPVERLGAVGWLETPAGRVLAVAERDACRR